MNTEEFLKYMNTGKPVEGGSELHQYMYKLSQEAMKITAEINGSYKTPEQIRELFAQLIGKPVDESFTLFPPFTSDCGKNIHLGKRIFVNAGCRFQDQGGITIGDDALPDRTQCCTGFTES